jgi:hypothetical protein
MSTALILKRATDHRTGDDFDVFNNDKLVGRIMLMRRDTRGRPYKDHAVDRESAMKEFAEAWRGGPT